MTRDSLADLGRRARRWIAVEELLFDTLGGWARRLSDPAAQRVFGTWCHRHAWHAELWRSRLPAIDVAGGDDDDVDGWIAPLRNAMQEVTTPVEALAVLRHSVVPALEEAVTEHRRAIDSSLDAPTARILDLVGADLQSERADVSAATSTA